MVKNILINSPSTREGSAGGEQKLAAPTNPLPPSTSTSQNKENNTVKLFSLQRESCSKELEEEMLRTKTSEQKFWTVCPRYIVMEREPGIEGFLLRELWIIRTWISFLSPPPPLTSAYKGKTAKLFSDLHTAMHTQPAIQSYNDFFFQFGSNPGEHERGKKWKGHKCRASALLTFGRF